jgi:hypothetical protein
MSTVGILGLQAEEEVNYIGFEMDKAQLCEVYISTAKLGYPD